MLSSSRITAGLLAVALLFASCGGGSDTSANQTDETMVLRGIAVSTGETITFDNLFDQDTVLWFWAPW